MPIVHVVIALCFAVPAASAVLANDLPGPGAPTTPAVTAAPPAPDSLAARLEQAPGCREISDGCQVCVRPDGGEAQCSTPGIACLPTGWQCKKKVGDGSDSPPPAARP